MGPGLFSVVQRNDPMRAASACLAILAAFSTLVLNGCTGSSGDRPVKTTVVATLEGEPLANVRITFNPVEGSRMAFGSTDANGRCSLTTQDGKEGCYPGQYKITVLASGAAQEADPKVATDFKTMMKERDRLTKLRRKDIHPNYGNVEKSPLKAEVPADGDVKIALNKTGK
jgi:hypothetical protein